MSKRGRLLIVVLATVGMLGTLTAGPALAGKSGHQPKDPPCSVTPSSASVGDTVTISAGGLPVDHWVNVTEQYPSYNRNFSGGSGKGTVSITDTVVGDFAVTPPYTVAISITDLSGSHPVVLSTCSFDVS